MASKKLPAGHDCETRRDFIKKTAVATALLSGAELLRQPACAQPGITRVTLVLDTADPAAMSPSVQWAAQQLRQTLVARGVAVRDSNRVGAAASDGECILIASRTAATAQPVLASAGATVAATPESLGLVRGRGVSRTVLLASGSDVRGMIYAVLELADRVQHSDDAMATLRSIDRVVEQPANPIRSVARLFTSDVEDKGWFNDKKFWSDYLTMLVAQRFNRFSLTLGLGYNRPDHVPDSYFYFAYPFLLTVPGYEVTARGLPDKERDANLAMLRWISDETKARGLHFQLGLWTHAYEFSHSPQVNHAITGLTAQSHGPYCRAALQQLLRACPAIDGVTFRAHSESGIPQGSYDFWPMIFEGVAACGRRVEIDIHSKGIEHELLEMALKTRLPVNVSPKYWAEHMGLPYHQIAIQKGEKFTPVAGKTATIEQQRRFTRYGYGDYLREDRAYGVLFRMWPGTQRFLLWGDPAMAAGYGRLSHFAGALGLEWCEPLSFKGRMGTGIAGDRNGYRDTSLRPPGGDWEKHLLTYRQWGRLLYNPDTDADGWRRYLRTEFGAAAADCEAALMRASRILPLITTAHLPSASNNQYWPEIPTSIPIAGNRFAAVDAIDPGLFSNIKEYAEELAAGARSGRYTPLDVAFWLESLADEADRRVAAARAKMPAGLGAAFQRLAIDVALQSGIGHFHAEKVRAGVAFALYQRLQSPALLGQALESYRRARATWAKLAETGQAYQADLTYGPQAVLRGNWKDRMPAIETDLAAMGKLWDEARGKGSATSERAVALYAAALVAAAKPGARPQPAHTPPPAFRRGESVALEATLEPQGKVTGVRLHYRHVNQAEEPQIVALTREGNRYRTTIPAQYTDSPYALMYFFELQSEGDAWISPGLNADLSNQPYYVIRQKNARVATGTPN